MPRNSTPRFLKTQPVAPGPGCFPISRSFREAILKSSSDREAALIDLAQTEFPGALRRPAPRAFFSLLFFGLAKRTAARSHLGCLVARFLEIEGVKAVGRFAFLPIGRTNMSPREAKSPCARREGEEWI